ncbi:MAG TPA: LacI family DNA-binding transcriptional regulator [Opitutaceae bacterium]|nr:LacI family DNA-binding transcriptional regulator [Opitutaceae bacterium]
MPFLDRPPEAADSVDPHLTARPTLRDIAEEIGVSIMSVSRALRNQPKVSAATARRIRQVARRLGYAPEPALSALVAQRERRRFGGAYGTIAVLFNWREPEQWMQVPSGVLTIRGVERQARTLGYQTENFSLKSKGMSGKRLSEILYHRGIRGVIVAPNEWPGDPIDLNWREFSVVTIEHEPTLPHFHHISPNYYSAVIEAWSQACKRGYRRIGFVTANREIRRVEHHWLAAFLLEQNRRPTEGGNVPPLLMPDYSDPARFADWYREHRPDVVLSRADREICTWLSHLGRRVPQDVGFLSLNVALKDSSGIVQNREKMGRIAVDVLHTKMLHFERGPDDALCGTVVENTWQEGRTLRRKG